MNIFHISAECYPVAKVGGLADVLGALPKYQNRIGHKASVIMPYYRTQWVEKSKGSVIFFHHLVMANKTYFSEIIEVENNLGFPLYLVRVNELTDRRKVYGYEDDTLRFMAFQQVALHWLHTFSSQIDIVHCHDHHSGFVPFMMKYCKPFCTLKNIPTILSIHNAQYQGEFSHEMNNIFPEFDKNQAGLLDWQEKINPLAAAIKCAYRVNTVSPSYMEELQEKANGLEGLLRAERAKCAGILNGIDTETWNPKTDAFLVKNYSQHTRLKGRLTNKKALCDEFDLSYEKPLFGFIGRLVWEKGADLLPKIIEESLEKFDINIIVLGSGNHDIEGQLENLKSKYNGRYNAHIGYEERLSHLVYASADFLLMPSRVEPCGLNQLYSLRYGCVPIVHRTGGLKDTVIDIGDGGHGICHDQTSVFDVVYSIGRAFQFYKETDYFKRNQIAMMKIDHSWENAAREYVSLYEEVHT
ncbi:glycogen synthase [Dokdonia sp. Hel_I_53]|uniref:glycogen synthase n=1 Tax=Dokdonia sp. Hel_I_53 TaxID=1566287 RepID=UPI001199CFFB|nr:glycogen synthase [Dokdonia sp. Hel_I_53]TVZ50885.1 starch synthase [Dokdonia sp. Hel_I_53]